MDKVYLTIDADAHLRKLASNYYRSDILNIIELIRSSLKRGASKVKIKLDKKAIIIEDNGSGISQEQIIKLKNIADLNRSQMEREEDILSFTKEYGIDIFVIFSFLPLNIKIENIINKQQDKITINESGLYSEHINSLKSGTRIMIKRKSVDIKVEARIIKEYCRNIGDKIEINGKPVIKQTIIQNMIISVNISNTDHEHIELGIAKSGSLCKLWTLNAGIPISVKTFQNTGGFVFEILTNTTSKDKTKELSVFAVKLYEHLIKKYEFYPEEIKKRIKELIYKHYNHTKKRLFINKLNSFKVLGKDKKLSIDQLEEITKNKKIYGILHKKDLKNTNSKGRLILILDRLDIDILVNSFNINIIFIQNNSNKIRIKESFISHWFNIIKLFISRRFRYVTKQSITEDETLFIKAIGSYLLQDKQLKNLFPEAKKIKIKMADQRFLIPSIITFSDENINIQISRKHKTIKKSMKLFKSDKRNLEWMLPQIVLDS